MKHTILALTLLLLSALSVFGQSSDASDYSRFYSGGGWENFYDTSSADHKGNIAAAWVLAIKGEVGILQLVELNCTTAAIRVHYAYALDVSNDRSITITKPTKWYSADNTSKALKTKICGTKLALGKLPIS